jgi:hypothetical protein
LVGRIGDPKDKNDNSLAPTTLAAKLPAERGTPAKIAHLKAEGWTPEQEAAGIKDVSK